MFKILDSFTLALIGTVTLASLLPVHGQSAALMDGVTTFAVALLFFLHGAKLSREAVIAGATHWRLHLLVMACTFALFPLLGLLLKPVLSPLVTPDLYLGILYLCMLPSTVQSSIAFTSLAKGNVPAAICSATASNLFGILLTPLLVGMLVVHRDAGSQGWHSVLDIVEQLLLPFIAGQIARRHIGRWVDKHKAMLKYVDQGSILLVVYTAFSAAVYNGLWQQLPASALAGLALCCVVLLAVLLMTTTLLSKKLGFNEEDRITIMFCGSKKSLASGVPMAKVLFAGQSFGALILPLMLFHQIQLMVCAFLAQRHHQRYAEREAANAGTEA